MFSCVDGRGRPSPTSTAAVLTAGVDTVWDILFSSSKPQQHHQMLTKPWQLSQSTVLLIISCSVAGQAQGHVLVKSPIK